MPNRELTKAETRKPYPEFPLFHHATGQWARKIRGKLHDFGTDPNAALGKYLDQRDDLQAGRTPWANHDDTTPKVIANAFLASRERLLDASELSGSRHHAQTSRRRTMGPNHGMSPSPPPILPT